MLFNSASFTGVLRILAILLLIYFGVKILGRVMGSIFNSTAKKPGFNRDENRPEGDVRVEYTDGKKPSNSSEVKEGEYIDFEELD